MARLAIRGRGSHVAAARVAAVPAFSPGRGRPRAGFGLLDRRTLDPLRQLVNLVRLFDYPERQDILIGLIELILKGFGKGSQFVGVLLHLGIVCLQDGALLLRREGRRATVRLARRGLRLRRLGELWWPRQLLGRIPVRSRFRRADCAPVRDQQRKNENSADGQQDPHTRLPPGIWDWHNRSLQVVGSAQRGPEGPVPETLNPC
jgi:hypothetical protein